MDAGNAFRIVVFKPVEPIEPVKDNDEPYDKRWISYDRLRVFYADPNAVLEKEEDGGWRKHVFRD